MGINNFLQIGNRIKYYRTKLGYSQSYMAQKLGIQRSTYSNYENNLREPKSETIEKIANILDIKVEDLLKYDAMWELQAELDNLNSLSPISIDSFTDRYRGTYDILNDTFSNFGISSSVVPDNELEKIFLYIDGIGINESEQDKLFKEIHEFLKFKAYQLKTEHKDI